MKNISLIILSMMAFASVSIADSAGRQEGDIAYSQANLECPVSDIYLLGLVKIPFQQFMGGRDTMEILFKLDEPQAIWMSKNQGEDAARMENIELTSRGRKDSYNFRFRLDPKDEESYIKGKIVPTLFGERIKQRVVTEKFGCAFVGCGVCRKLR